MRDAMADARRRPRARSTRWCPAELVIDHSVQVDVFGTPRRVPRQRRAASSSATRSATRSCAGARTRSTTSRSCRPTPASCTRSTSSTSRASSSSTSDGRAAYPDTLVGTDSHTTMINGLGVLGWGVGGIEAEAAMLGQPMSMLIPQVVGFQLHGELPEGATATDLVLTVTQMLREHGVVGKFVEFYGDGLPNLPLADRATIGNMAPEFGSTCGIFPIDAETLRYLRVHRPRRGADRARRGLRQGAGPVARRGRRGADVLRHARARPRRRRAVARRARSARRTACSLTRRRKARSAMALEDVLPTTPQAGRDEAIEESFPASDPPARNGDGHAPRRPEPAGTAPAACRSPSARRDRAGDARDGTETELDHGAVVIAAITSCTNTSNPAVMLGAGLLARNAVGARPEGQAVGQDLAGAGLEGRHRLLRARGPDRAARGSSASTSSATAARPASATPGRCRRRSPAASTTATSPSPRCCRGNRNFEGRINPDVKMNYLASPPLVVAYALAGTMDIDLLNEPLGHGPRRQGRLPASDIWPSTEEVARTVEEAVQCGHVHAQPTARCSRATSAGTRSRCPRATASPGTTTRPTCASPPYFDGMPTRAGAVGDIEGARVLGLLGDSVTTDHISPAGSIKKDTPGRRAT